MTYRILILEDDEERIKQFNKKFTGHHIEVFDTAGEVIDKLQKEEWDYLFLDHDLGLSTVDHPIFAGDGYQVAKFLYRNPKRKPSIGIIIHSLNPAGAERMKGLLPEAHMHPFVWKC